MILEIYFVVIDNRDYAIWYRDMAEDMDKYVGKTLKMTGIVARDKSLKATAFAFGRMVMTCCADDIAYRGVVAKGSCGIKLQTRDWITVTGKLTEEYSPLYRGRGPVLIVSSTERAEKPTQEVATFY